MISLVLSLLFTCWTLSVLFFVRHILIPYIADRIEEARWQRLHPNMPSWRRPHLTSLKKQGAA
jgi:hypothetical protein